jgi:hypothetical protein
MRINSHSLIWPLFVVLIYVFALGEGLLVAFVVFEHLKLEAFIEQPVVWGLPLDTYHLHVLLNFRLLHIQDSLHEVNGVGIIEDR